jgi:hypothetical protein
MPPEPAMRPAQVHLCPGTETQSMAATGHFCLILPDASRAHLAALLESCKRIDPTPELVKMRVPSWMKAYHHLDELPNPVVGGWIHSDASHAAQHHLDASFGTNDNDVYLYLDPVRGVLFLARGFPDADNWYDVESERLAAESLLGPA